MATNPVTLGTSSIDVASIVSNLDANKRKRAATRQIAAAHVKREYHPDFR